MFKKINGLKLHIKSWSRWRKYSTAGLFDDILVLFRIRKPASFALVKMSVAIEMVAENLKKATKALDGYTVQHAVCDEMHCKEENS